MCEKTEPPVGQYDLVALTKEEQKLLKAAPELVEMLARLLDYLANGGVTPDAEDIYDEGVALLEEVRKHDQSVSKIPT